MTDNSRDAGPGDVPLPEDATETPAPGVNSSTAQGAGAVPAQRNSTVEGMGPVSSADQGYGTTHGGEVPQSAPSVQGGAPAYGPFRAGPNDATPAAEPVDEYGLSPSSGGPYNFGAPAGPVQYGAGTERFGFDSAPSSGVPSSGVPSSGVPSSGVPSSGVPSSGGPAFGPPAFGGPGFGGPRIEPTPKKPKGTFVVPALAGLVAGLLIFGAGGWFLGRSTAPDSPTTVVAQPSAGPAPSASIGAYEQNQLANNKPKFTGPLAPLGEGWLTRLSSCSRNGEATGPKLNPGEKARVRCEMDAMSVIFVEYTSAADRDKARVTTLGQNIEARKLTSGVTEPAVRPTPSGRSNGNYVEYAYQVSGRTVAGIRWDDSATPVAAYILAYWKEGIGQKWDPLREVWTRYA